MLNALAGKIKKIRRKIQKFWLSAETVKETADARTLLCLCVLARGPASLFDEIKKRRPLN